MYIFAFMRLTPWQRIAFVAGIVVSILVCTKTLSAVSPERARWSPRERAVMRSLTLSSRGALPLDPSNRYADDSVAARLGHLLFFDDRLSRTGEVSCATCHVPEKDFQDGRSRAHGVGEGSRRTMPIAGTSRSPWLFWDGRADSQWQQALGPLENPVEHGGDRTQYALLIAKSYKPAYESVFGALPALNGLPAHAGPVADSGSAGAWMHLSDQRRQDISRVYANIGKAIAAYERRIELAPSRFDEYVAAELASESPQEKRIFTSDEEAGLRLFIGKANCVDCHNGSAFSDNHFHNTGVAVASVELAPDSGRAAGALKARDGEFSCTSRYSDAGQGDCAELRFAVTEGAELVRAFKTPSLRNVANRAPYMHAGQIASLSDVLRHYSDAPQAPFGRSELKPLHLSIDERRQIIAFLATLTGAPAAASDNLVAANPREGAKDE